MSEETEQTIYLTKLYKQRQYGCYAIINDKEIIIKKAFLETIANSIFQKSEGKYDFTKKIIYFDPSNINEMPAEVRENFSNEKLATPPLYASEELEKRIMRLINNEKNKSSALPK
jgi:hypothetical protein